MTISQKKYEKAIKILSSQGKFYINLGLERIQNLLSLYDNPQNKIKCIHIAGTNGKGSTCAMIASILQYAGYKTGLYTSPHLVNYTERIKINAKYISKNDFAELLFDVVMTAEKNRIHATEFEILTAMAFLYFYREKVDFAVIETGLGGRLDATNIIQKPLISVITSISLDHTDRLGNTIEEIACEKAGIIKKGVPVVTFKENLGIEIIKNKALESASELFFIDYRNTLNFNTTLKGSWQKQNMSLALKTVELLKNQGMEIPDNAIKEGLMNVQWAGRFQFIQEMNLILDGAHNPDSARVLRETLDILYPNEKRIWIYSSISTKNYPKIMETLFIEDRKSDTVILTKSAAPAAVHVQSLKKELQKSRFGGEIYFSESIKEAVEIFLNIRKDNSIGVLVGSLYSAGEFIVYFNQILKEKT